MTAATAYLSSYNMGPLRIEKDILNSYSDVFTKEVLLALSNLASLDCYRKELMKQRISRRADRFCSKELIDFLDPYTTVGKGGTKINVQDARDGNFEGPEIPQDLVKQWIQGTGPAAKPNAPIGSSIRNTAYALLSGADGWMFDGEDALGQVKTMSLDNQRNLKHAIHKDPIFMNAAEQVQEQINQWAVNFHGHALIEDWKKQLSFTTKIFRPRGLHLDDRHILHQDGGSFSASICDMTIYVVNNYQRLHQEGSSIVLYLPKIQTAEEAALWNDMLLALEDHLSLQRGAIKVYVLVEQLEAAFQLMEIRAALGLHFVGFNTGRWDYINSVVDAMAWSTDFVNPDIEHITMTYGFMRNYEDRVRRAVNTPDKNGRFSLWQGGMEANIPVGSSAGVEQSMRKALAGAIREQSSGASGKWVAHWKMVAIVRKIWECQEESNQMGRMFQPLTYANEDRNGLILLEEAPRTISGIRNMLSITLQYGNAFLQGFQAVALKSANFFGDEDVLYLMEDMATGEIRLSVIWEWVHKSANLSQHDAATGLQAGEPFNASIFKELLQEEYGKLSNADDRDVHNDSKLTTLPIAKEIVSYYVLCDMKIPWFIDLLNINLNNRNINIAKTRIEAYITAFKRDGTRLTENIDLKEKEISHCC